jgi:hypothetical protein
VLSDQLLPWLIVTDLGSATDVALPMVVIHENSTLLSLVVMTLCEPS